MRKLAMQAQQQPMNPVAMRPGAHVPMPPVQPMAMPQMPQMMYPAIMPTPQPMPPQARAPGRRLPPSPPQTPGPPRTADASAYGTLSIRVQPADADVLIDREKWHGPEAQDQLIVDVAEGPHTVEIQKSGYRTYVTEVQVRRGDTTTLNVSLRTQNER